MLITNIHATFPQGEMNKSNQMIAEKESQIFNKEKRVRIAKTETSLPDNFSIKKFIKL